MIIQLSDAGLEGKMRRGSCNIVVTGLVVLFLYLAVCRPAFTQEYEIIHLGSLGGTSGRSKDINRLGQIVGESETNEGKTHAFFWTQKTGMIDLGTLGGQYSWVSAINNLGEVVGYSYNRSGVPRCFLWTESGGMVEIDTLGECCEAMDINDLKQVVGYSERSNEMRAFILDRTNGMQDLNDLILAPADWKFDTALAINNVGKVVVRGNSEVWVKGKTGIPGFFGTFFYLIWSAKPMKERKSDT